MTAAIVVDESSLTLVYRWLMSLETLPNEGDDIVTQQNTRPVDDLGGLATDRAADTLTSQQEVNDNATSNIEN